MNASKKPSTPNLHDLPPPLESFQLGVWRIFRERSTSLAFLRRYLVEGLSYCSWAIDSILEHGTFFFAREAYSTLMYGFESLWQDRGYGDTTVLLHVFLAEIYRILGFRLSMAYICCRVWIAASHVFYIYVDSRAARIFVDSFSAETPDCRNIIMVICFRVAVSAMTRCVDWYIDSMRSEMKRRITMHFNQRIIDAHVQLNVTKFRDTVPQPLIFVERAWHAFDDLWQTLDFVFSTTSLCVMLASTFRNNHIGTSLIFLSAARPLVEALLSNNLYSRGFVYHSNNPSFVRAEILFPLGTSGEYRQEVIAGNLGKYVSREYKKAQAALVGKCVEAPAIQYTNEVTPFITILQGVVFHIPMIFYLASSMLKPATFSISSFLMVQESTHSIGQSFANIHHLSRSWTENLGSIKTLYDSTDVGKRIPDGHLPYPQDKDYDRNGMELEFQNVTFRYPGADPTIRATLRNVSFRIPASSLVVIVGGNGSGKSSLLTLLTHLYEPTSGEIFVNGNPYKDYRDEDVRKATALFTQKHNFLPLTLFENVAFGDEDIDLALQESPELVHAAVKEAINLGGADIFLNDSDGSLSETMCRDPTVMTNPMVVLSDQLRDIWEELTRTRILSGGEAQRLMASRTFMRLLRRDIKLLVLDEPTSALDAAGERDLFNNLLSMRGGKTIVVVTHRFGHITPHADLILCLKEGELVDAGTHEELMQKCGEYSDLYNIQRESFLRSICLRVPVSQN